MGLIGRVLGKGFEMGLSEEGLFAIENGGRLLHPLIFAHNLNEYTDDYDD